MPMRALVTITTEDGSFFEVPIGDDPLSIGRAQGNLVRAGDRNISRHHAVIRRAGDGSYVVEDAGSSYGTFLNGAPVTRPTPLRGGETMHIGDLQVRFALVEEAVLDPGFAEETTQVIPAAPEAPPPAAPGIDPAELKAAREREEALMEQIADLRKEVRMSQEDEDRARHEKAEADKLLVEARAALEQQRAQVTALEARATRAEREITRLSQPPQPDVETAALQKQVRELRGAVESQRAQIAKMEDRDAGALAMRKEIERLAEQLKQREQREAAVSESLRPAMARITELTAEVTELRKKLAFAEVELAEARRGR